LFRQFFTVQFVPSVLEYAISSVSSIVCKSFRQFFSVAENWRGSEHTGRSPPSSRPAWTV